MIYPPTIHDNFGGFGMGIYSLVAYFIRSARRENYIVIIILLDDPANIVLTLNISHNGMKNKYCTLQLSVFS